MKRNMLLLVLIFIVSCDLPSEPVGIRVVYEYHQDTEDFCRGLDVSNGVLVAAASSNGYYRFNIVNEGDNPILQEALHITDINPNVGDDSVFDVLIADGAEDIAIILDDVDNILVDNFSTDETSLITQNPCGNSLLYRSIAVNDDNPDTTVLFTLQKHFDVVPNNFETYSTSIGVREYYNDTVEQFGINVETFISNPGCIPIANPNIEAMQLFYADSILTLTQGPYVKIYKYLQNIELQEEYVESSGDGSSWGYLEQFTDLNDNTFWDGDSCGFIDSNNSNEFDVGAEEYFCPYELGYDADNPSWIEYAEPFIDCGYTLTLNDLNENGFYDEGESYVPILDLNLCEDADIPGNGRIDSEDFVDYNGDGKCCGSYIGDSLEERYSFHIAGGEANCTYSYGNAVIGGYSNFRGCYMALLDSDGSEISNLTFADGYSISAIGYDHESGLLALGAGNDGILIYDWNGEGFISLRGILDVGDNNYVFDVEVMGSSIYVGSENGITIYKIEG